jgi:fatty aldehyde-generating acyl-ACP reductase
MYLRNEPPWFAFLIHPRDIHDLFRWKGSRLLRQYSDSDEDFLAKATSLEPTMIGEVILGFGGARGELVGAMRMPAQVMGRGGRQAVHDALRLAVDRGAKVVGLGALTAPATAAGRSLLREVPNGVTITTGNAYTAAVARHNVVSAVASLGLDRPAQIAVLGASGSVGVPTSHLLVRQGFEVTVIGRNLGRVRATLGDLAGDAVFADNLEPLAKADVVLVLTSETSALVTPADVRAGAVIVDVTQPPNIPPAAFASFEARSVRVVPGGLAHIPRYRSTYDLAIPIPGATFACLAETYLMAREGIREHSVGAPAPEFALRMEQVAARHGVRPAALGFSRTSETTGTALGATP